MLSIIIPTLNSGASLEKALSALDRCRGSLAFEVVVVDGGSTDDTTFQAEQGGAILIESPRGRGRQMAAGVEVAAGDWFLFLRADTQLDVDWGNEVFRFMTKARNLLRAGYFRFALDDKAWLARWIERCVYWRCLIMGLPYGDQGLLISRSFYEQLGGYKRAPLMEDVEMASRIGRRRLKRFRTRALTSAEGYRRDGFLLRPLRNLFCLGLYALGVPPRYIDGIYR